MADNRESFLQRYVIAQSEEAYNHGLPEQVEHWNNLLGLITQAMGSNSMIEFSINMESLLNHPHEQTRFNHTEYPILFDAVAQYAEHKIVDSRNGFKTYIDSAGERILKDPQNNTKNEYERSSAMTEATVNSLYNALYTTQTEFNLANRQWYENVYTKLSLQRRGDRMTPESKEEASTLPVTDGYRKGHDILRKAAIGIAKERLSAPAINVLDEKHITDLNTALARLNYIGPQVWNITTAERFQLWFDFAYMYLRTSHVKDTDLYQISKSAGRDGPTREKAIRQRRIAIKKSFLPSTTITENIRSTAAFMMAYISAPTPPTVEELHQGIENDKTTAYIDGIIDRIPKI